MAIVAKKKKSKTSRRKTAKKRKASHSYSKKKKTSSSKKKRSKSKFYAHIKKRRVGRKRKTRTTRRTTKKRTYKKRKTTKKKSAKKTKTHRKTKKQHSKKTKPGAAEGRKSPRIVSTGPLGNVYDTRVMRTPRVSSARKRAQEIVKRNRKSPRIISTGPLGNVYEHRIHMTPRQRPETVAETIKRQIMDEQARNQASARQREMGAANMEAAIPPAPPYDIEMWPPGPSAAISRQSPRGRVPQTEFEDYDAPAARGPPPSPFVPSGMGPLPSQVPAPIIEETRQRGPSPFTVNQPGGLESPLGRRSSRQASDNWIRLANEYAEEQKRLKSLGNQSGVPPVVIPYQGPPSQRGMPSPSSNEPRLPIRRPTPQSGVPAFALPYAPEIPTISVTRPTIPPLNLTPNVGPAQIDPELRTLTPTGRQSGRGRRSSRPSSTIPEIQLNGGPVMTSDEMWNWAGRPHSPTPLDMWNWPARTPTPAEIDMWEWQAKTPSRQNSERGTPSLRSLWPMGEQTPVDWPDSDSTDSSVQLFSGTYGPPITRGETPEPTGFKRGLGEVLLEAGGGLYDRLAPYMG